MRPGAAKQVLKCYIKTFSPLHIGCDEVYEPTGFVVDENQGKIVVLDQLDFITSLPDEERRQFNHLCGKGTVASILEIYNFLRNKPADGRRVDVCKGFIHHYKKTLSMSTSNEKGIQQELNRFSIPRTSFLSADQRPFLPGSSVKGALRTAYNNFLEKEKQLAKTKKHFTKGLQLERALMENEGIPDDPFRLVKISDFMPVGDVKTKIVYGVNIKKHSSDKEARGLPLLFEVIQPGAVFEGTISITPSVGKNGIKRPVDLEAIVNSALYFYGKEKKREERELAAIGIPQTTQFDDASTPIRCGRHSGAESVTIEGHRSIKIMGKKGENPRLAPKATTFWLVSDEKKPQDRKRLKPFGWAGIFKKTEALQRQYTTLEEEYQNIITAEKKAKTEKLIKQEQLRQEAIEEEKRQAAAAEEKRLAEEKRAAELAAMTPEERLIVEANGPEANDEKLNQLSNRLEDLPEPLKKEAAQLLKEHWQKQNKWVKKDFSTKQWQKWRDKINTIKAILGENC